MTGKSHVGMGFSVCPVCGIKHDEVVLIDTRLRDTLERDNFRGWALCPEHQKMDDDGFLALIEVSAEPKGANTHEMLCNAKRTGQIAHLRRTVANNVFGRGIPAEMLFVFIDEQFIPSLQANMQKDDEVTDVEPKGEGDDI